MGFPLCLRHVDVWLAGTRVRRPPLTHTSSSHPRSLPPALPSYPAAGKTTTMNLLTGLMPPTRGSACAHGLSVTDDMEAFRRQLGVCPQHDVLWPTLTVTEHLRFFAGLKGVAPAAVADAVTDIIRRVGLTEKTLAQAGTLSGGQKRKLCLGIALIGGSRVLIIDEATSGMVRRATRR